MSFALWIALLSLGLFLGMIAAYEVGRRLGVRRLAKEQRDQLPGAGVIEGAVFALLGLLIAFTFQGAASRFDDRRQLIIKEYNAIGAAYLRIGVLAPDEQPALRASFRTYLDSRLETYRRLPNLAAARAELLRSEEIQQEIWHQAVAGSARSPGPAGILDLEYPRLGLIRVDAFDRALIHLRQTME